MHRLLSIALLCVPVLLRAEITPPKGAYDARVRVVDYNPADVVRLATFFGVSTHIQFGEQESIQDVSVGDQEAWHIVPRGRHLFVKPKDAHADTNVTVITDRRVYHFALVVQPRNLRDATAWRDRNLVYSLSFRYPDEEAAAREAQARQAQTEAVAHRIAQQLEQPPQPLMNDDYWVAGAAEISPSAAWDDGRFIYLSFSGNRDMPAIYAVGPDGAEALINTHVEGNQIVVQRMVRQLTLRKGTWVACIVNRRFDITAGSDNTTGTVAPGVERVIREAPR